MILKHEDSLNASKETKDIRDILKGDIADSAKISQHEFIRKKEEILAKFETLIITYLKNFEKTIPQLTLENLTLIVRYGPVNETIVQSTLEKMVKNPAGKLLLYRILIEVKKINPSIYVINGRFANITFDSKKKIYGLMFDPTLIEQLTFPAAYDIPKPDIPEGGVPEKHTLMYSEKEPRANVALFHEMLHLFHNLNGPKRVRQYRSGTDSLDRSDIRMHPLFLSYYGDHKSCDIKNEQWKNSLFVWINKNTRRVNFEEMITIRGLPIGCSSYKIGDELSENLYRVFEGLPLRFGHNLQTFVESNDVVRRVIGSLNPYIELFKQHASIPAAPIQYGSDDYEVHSSQWKMTRHDGVGGMYFYTIPHAIPPHIDCYFESVLDKELYVRKDHLKNYYYLKDHYYIIDTKLD